ncbi:uncharacterized protein LJ206_001909 [Theristicus caerulescens]
MADSFPLRLTKASELPSVSVTAPAMPPPVTAGVLPSSVPGLPVSRRPAQVHTVTSQLAQATVWQGVPGPLGAPGQVLQLPGVVPLPPVVQLPPMARLPPVVQLPCGVQLPPGVQLPHGVQLPPRVQLPPEVQLPPGGQLPCGVQLPTVAAPCPPAYGWGQQVLMRTLLPHQPMGLGPWAAGQGELLDPTGPPLLHTLPGSAQKPSQASNKDGAAIKDSVPAASPHQTALALPTSRTTMKPKGEVWGVAEPMVGWSSLGKPALP